MWENPIKEYESDNGQHPSEEQTVALISFLNKRTEEDYGFSYRLESASDDMVTTHRIYSNVNALYKYGCTGCRSKTKNKWYNLCLECKENIKTDERTQQLLGEFNERVEQLDEINNPWLPEAAADDTNSTNSDSTEHTECTQSVLSAQ